MLTSRHWRSDVVGQFSRGAPTKRHDDEDPPSQEAEKPETSEIAGVQEILLLPSECRVST